MNSGDRSCDLFVCMCESAWKTRHIIWNAMAMTCYDHLWPTLLTCPNVCLSWTSSTEMEAKAQSKSYLELWWLGPDVLLACCYSNQKNQKMIGSDRSSLVWSFFVWTSVREAQLPIPLGNRDVWAAQSAVAFEITACCIWIRGPSWVQILVTEDRTLPGSAPDDVDECNVFLVLFLGTMVEDSSCVDMHHDCRFKTLANSERILSLSWCIWCKISTCKWMI